MNTVVPIKRALLSISDKSGLLDLAKALSKKGVEILSTGGSAKVIRAAGIEVKEVADHTGFPEMMDGRVKTLHPKIHGGILALRDKDAHTKAMNDHNIDQIDLVVINLYPFEKTVATGADFETCIENIDIGGPAMVRSAAKNYKFVTIITDPSDYGMVIEEINKNGGTTIETRKKLAAKAFNKTGAYDVAIATWFAQEGGEEFPDKVVFSGSKVQICRYGENPHQSAAFYKNEENRPGISTAYQHQGKELSYNNLNDTDAAFELVSEFDPSIATVAIIKHANPCGVAMGETLLEAYQKALMCDPISAFGGIVALNRTLDPQTAAEISKVFTEVIIAPEISPEALELLSAKKSLRVLSTNGLADPTQGARILKTVAGGYLLQNRDTGRVTKEELKVVTKRRPSDAELSDLLFAFQVSKHVKSNAIVYVKDGMTVGVGAGQMNRKDSSRIAALRAEEASKAAGKTESLAKGSVVASDAFFPFADGLMEAANAGATAVIQPGGSMRDDEVIKAADEAGIAMVMTGMRHFKH
ncbi:MAG: bifunctional phosphoribosylaminoimidazolecarboxamide formyltransferase/IMP cyclohydrolase [Sphingomonadales bacterium]